jgi:polyhydroxyalkanoate synthesis regulator phasin
MSYEQAKKCLADVRQRCPPQTKPIEYDMAGALVALTEAIEHDFKSLRSEITALRRQVEDLKR